MIFNLNEQKVLSDPSGSSVFKGEKDFNDIVVNLPDNIDGHTATELNYVMHFVDSDGGYSTKILTVDSSGETLKATATVSTNITSKAQAFYAYVLMTNDEETVIGKTNGVIVMIRPVPDEENEIIPPADADKIIKGLEEIVKEATETIEEATEAISSKQDKLTAGKNITISDDNVISAEGGGVTSYNDLTYKPKFNGADLEGEVRFGGGLDYRPLSDYYYLSIDSNNVLNKIYGISDSIYGSGSLFGFQNESNIYDFLPTNDSGVLFKFRDEYYHESTQTLLQHYIFFPSVGNKIYLRTDSKVYGEEPIIGQWQEIGGGSQIVSGVVNANGTITFTDSDGSTFTTTGSSVIGPQGDDYVLTAQDKSDIADIVLSELPNADTMSF